MFEPLGIVVGQIREWSVIDPLVSAARAGEPTARSDMANATSNATEIHREIRDLSISLLLLEL